MEKKFKLGVIGAGYMASAIIKGAISSGFIDKSTILVSDVTDSSLEKFSNLSISTTKNNVDVVKDCEFVLFAVKPQNFKDLAGEIASYGCSKIISIMAGVKINTIKEFFPNSQVARCMPNAPCFVGSGAVGIDLKDYIESNDALFIKGLFAACASVVEIDEDKLGVVTGISGSAPAYFYLFAKGIIDAGVKNGLTVEQSTDFVINTMIGSGKMLLNNHDKSIDELISSVCSKGGTTIEAIKVYNQSNLTDITHKAVDACIKRSKELENL